MKSVILLLCVAVAVQAQQQRPMPTRPPPQRPDQNDNSMCRFMDRMCPANHECIERRDMQLDRPVYRCVMRLAMDAACPMRNVFGGSPGDKERRAVEPERTIPEERARQIPQGGRDRESSRRINGVDTRPSCAQNQRCNDQDMCTTPPTNTQCTMRRENNNATRCNIQGMFERQQFSRVSGEQTTDTPTQLTGRCVNPMNGQTIPGTERRVRTRDDVPDCDRIGTRSCPVMRDGRMVEVQHEQSTLRRMGGNCQRCQCNDGTIECNSARENDRCDRFDMDDNDDNQRRSCMRDGQMIPHNERRQVGKCNRCGCRNGVLQCTNIQACRDDMEQDADSDQGRRERSEEDEMCDECMNMPAVPMCSVRDGRTFPTLCHALRCQGLSRDDVMEGACSERDSCSREGCSGGTSCFQRGGQTRMSREGSSSEDRRLCVNRQELHCQPTETARGGERRLADRGDGEENLLMRFIANRRDNDDDDDQSVCASDGNQYPSTCHMMVEARGDQIPRVNHSGPCREAEQRQQVCGRDGVTYDDMQTMRTRGGNVDPDYMGRCMQQGNTPNEKCMMVRENNRCPNISRCPPERRIRPADGCCAVCGAAVQMAMDQEAMDQHVRGTGELGNIDDLMGNLFREGGRRNDQGMPRPPVLNSTIARRCNMSATRPTHTRANTTEVIFRARDMAEDAQYCHERAMEFMGKMNGEVDNVVTIETDLVAAATVAPQDEVAGAPAIVASCMVVVLAYLTTLLF